MTRLGMHACLLLAIAALAGNSLQAQSIGKTIEAIELRYNSLSGLRMKFEQTMEFGGRKRMAERGTLYLSRPGKMRWDYTQPVGKIAVSDGTIFRMYSPLSNQVRQVRLDEMTDLRAPLSFLLGRMRLRRMFKDLQLSESDGQGLLEGKGRRGSDFFAEVQFTFDLADYRISTIRILGRDGSVNAYAFSDEELNPSLDAGLFEFTAPPGAEVVALTRNFSGVPVELDEP